MTLEDVYFISQIAASLAVLASLTFLFFQMRQVSAQIALSEKNQRALLNQGALAQAGELVRWLGQSSGLVSRVQAGETQFSGSELVELNCVLRLYRLGVQDVLVQQDAGLLDKTTFDNNLNAFKRRMQEPVFRVLWQMYRHTYAPELAKMVDDIIATTPIPKRGRCFLRRG